MSKTKELFIEALNPLNRIANSIIKKLNYIESSVILKAKSYEEVQDLLQKTSVYHSNAFDELNEEQQDIVLHKVWNTIHNVLGQKPVEEEVSTKELEAKIYNFLKSNGGIMYPLEISAKKLANAIKQK